MLQEKQGKGVPQREEFEGPRWHGAIKGEGRDLQGPLRRLDEFCSRLRISETGGDFPRVSVEVQETARKKWPFAQ